MLGFLSGAAQKAGSAIAHTGAPTPFPGTEMWEIAKKNGTISDDWNSFTFYAPDKMPFSSNILGDQELLDLYKHAYKSYYLRPSFMLKQFFKIRSFADIHRNWLAARGIMGW